jgi:hypothetical protein
MDEMISNRMGTGYALRVQLRRSLDGRYSKTETTKCRG